MAKEKVKTAMEEFSKMEIPEELIILFPDDGYPGHSGTPHWDVYGARMGKFTIIAHAYDDGTITVRIF